MYTNVQMRRQIIACFLALSPFILDGINDGYSSNILHQKNTNTIPFQIDDSDLSWIASASIVSMPVGSLYSGPLMHIYGRKKVLQSLCLLGLLGWVLIFAAESVFVLCIGRLLNGLAMGMQITSIMYISEISDTPELRAFLLSLINPAIGLGTTICYITGYIFSAQFFSMSICWLTFSFFLLTFLLPESPVWLMMKNNHEGAAKALKWLHRAQNNGKENVEDQQVNSVSNGIKLSLKTRIMVTKAWKPLIHLTVFFLLQILTGNPVFIYYAANIYESLNTPINSSLSAVILATVQFFTLICVCWFIDKLDRRTWTKISSVGICISYLIMALNEYMFSDTIKPRPSNWLPLISSWVGAVFSSVGMYSIPWILLGELFPETVGDFMGGLQMMIIYVLQFLSIKTYPLLVPALDIYGFCIVFSVGGLLSFLYAQFIMPETRGKTVAEIEKIWL